jgi:glucose/arabinose dehydrogenase
VRLWRATLGLAAAACCLGAVVAQSAQGVVLAPGFRDKLVFAGLQEPTAMRFAPDGRVFVAQKSGKIVVFAGLGASTPSQFVDLSRIVYDHGDRGLLGLALDPHFDEGKPYVYALYTYDHILGKTPADGEEGKVPRWGNPEQPVGDSCPKPSEAEVDDCPVSGRLVRLTAEGNHAKLGPFGEVEEKVLVEDWCQQFSSHSIGGLQFDSNGALYASGGDGASFNDVDYGQFGWPNVNQCGDPPNPVGTADTPPTAEGGALRAQDLRTGGDPVGLDGTIIRIDPETGEGLPGNPMFDSASQNARRIIAYGLRNPFRFAIDQENGEIYAGNVGWNTWEEIDRLPTLPNHPFNSGWPCYEGPEKNPSYEGLGLNICQGLYAEPGSTSPPFFFYKHFQDVIPGDECTNATGSAISGLALYPGSGPFPAAYDHALFFADSVRGCIFVAFAGPDGRPDASTITNFMWEGGLYPGVDLQVGPEGNLYYVKIFDATDEEGKIHQISYEPDAPFASISASPRWGPLNLPTGLKIQFDGSESSDPNGEALTYEWDLDGDGEFDDSTSEKPTLIYKAAKNVTVSLRVKDESGKSSVAKTIVYPGDTPPSVEITEPSPSLTWGVGQQIHFAGVATDNEEGTLPASKLGWKTRVLHCPAACHQHPLQSYPEVSSGVLEAPDHDYPSHLDFVFTATDSRGLSASQTVQIDPRPVTLHLASDPAGVTLGAGARSEAGPFDLTVIEGGRITLSAPESVDAGGKSLPFRSWSDGGARVHTIVANAPATYTALYRGPEEPSPPAPDRPPQSHLLKHPPKLTASSSARFAFAANQPGSRFECKLDAAPFKRCRSPRAYLHLKPGRHVFAVRAVNPTGTVERKPAAFAWRVLPQPG